MADHDNTPHEAPAVRRHRRRSSIECPRQQDGSAEDRLTSLPEDLLVSILPFLPIKQCVALSALCSHFRRRLPSLIPRLDTFSLHVVGDVIPQQQTFPRALIRQCHILFSDITYLSERLQRLLVEVLVESGVQDLTLEYSGQRWMNISFRKNCGFLGIKSLRSLSLHRISVRRPPPIACPLLTSLKLEHCILHRNDFLPAFLASCPFLETLHFLCSSEIYLSQLSIRSASIKHLVLLYELPIVCPIDVHCPKLESLTVNTTALRIEEAKVRHASLILSFDPPADPLDALMKLLGDPNFHITAVCLMLNSSTIPNVRGDENEFDRFIYPKIEQGAVIFNFGFNLNDESSTMILAQLLEEYTDSDIEFDILVDSTDADADAELIKIQIIMSEKMFEGFVLNEEKMEELKRVGLQKLKSRTSREQLNDILASNEPLVEVSTSIANCIEMKF